MYKILLKYLDLYKYLMKCMYKYLKKWSIKLIQAIKIKITVYELTKSILQTQ